MLRLPLILVVFVFCSSSLWAATPSDKPAKPRSFQRWKKEQVVTARNNVVRLTNRMHLLKTDKYKLDKDKRPLLDEPDEKLYQDLRALGKEDSEKREEMKSALLGRVENKMQMAIENLQIAKELSLDDYIAVYLSQYSDDPRALKHVAKKFSDDEIIALIHHRLRGNPSTANPAPTDSNADLVSEGIDAKQVSKK